MRKFTFLFIFSIVTIANVLMLVAFRRVNSGRNLEFSKETLDLSGAFNVTIDSDFLKNNLKPAYE